MILSCKCKMQSAQQQVIAKDGCAELQLTHLSERLLLPVDHAYICPTWPLRNSWISSSTTIAKAPKGKALRQLAPRNKEDRVESFTCIQGAASAIESPSRGYSCPQLSFLKIKGRTVWTLTIFSGAIYLTTYQHYLLALAGFSTCACRSRRFVRARHAQELSHIQ